MFIFMSFTLPQPEDEVNQGPDLQALDEVRRPNSATLTLGLPSLPLTDQVGAQVLTFTASWAAVRLIINKHVCKEAICNG